MAKLKKTGAGDNLPYEKCINFGPKYLSDTELLAVLIRNGTREKNCIEIAEELLSMAGDRGILSLRHFTLKDFSKIKGIGRVKGIMLSCIGELSARIARAQLNLRQFTDSGMIADYYMEELRHLEKEHFFLMMLNSKCGLIHESLLSIGTISHTCLSPREIFKEALEYGAVYIIMVHNHPSGNPTPSEDDLITTKTVRDAGKIIGIPLLDHIIIGDKKYVSMREKNMI